MVDKLLTLYLQLGGGVLCGLLLGRLLPATVPYRLGKFLFWIGVPLSIVGFLQQAQLGGAVWLAPAIAWVAILLGVFLAWLWLNWPQRFRPTDHQPTPWSKSERGSFMLTAMVGNTGYLGYPVSLSLVGPQYFAWALFYDMVGTLLGAYGLGVVLAAYFGRGDRSVGPLLRSLVYNPAPWSLGLGLVLRQLPLPAPVEQGLLGTAWAMLGLSLLLIGMRLGQLSSWRSLQQGLQSLSIKMLTVPLLVGIALSLAGITGAPRLVLVLQAAMPPAFATLVISEAYDLDRTLTVTCLAVGTVGLLMTLPLWLWLFGL
ncbi:AEC family transporter [Trichothermofontia sichuanensis B231]|uniref:AEC family transporter n=1 Tax=Trichothermofontia sichuanensis TaxID=3045816 RepID=UPI002246ED48|nr:AEC family transporter [Trichothermofontia sichuanensis]UZQ55772.1 AEC family transporter [Trichothermofontia sichuanensis B231]